MSETLRKSLHLNEAKSTNTTAASKKKKSGSSTRPQDLKNKKKTRPTRPLPKKIWVLNKTSEFSLAL